MDRAAIIHTYLEQVRSILTEIPVERIEAIVDILHRARTEGKRVYILGNGGSAATASHFASDLNKGAISPEQPRFKAFALTDNTPQVTAWANDSSYEDIFAQQLENYLEPGDIVIGISGSGKSMNVVKALELARDKKAVTIALTGFDGGKVKEIADLSLIVPGGCMEQVEDIHLLLEHAITKCLRNIGTTG